MTNKPTLLTHEQVMNLQMGLHRFAEIIKSADTKMIRQYVKEARPQLPGGTQEDDLKQMISMEALARAQRIIGYHMQLCELILKAEDIVNKYEAEGGDFKGADKVMDPSN